MAQNPFDQLAKQYLEEFLAESGQVVRNLEVPGEAKFVDVFFAPNPEIPTSDGLGLLGRMTQQICAIEPFRNAPTRHEVRTCILKLLWLQEQERRQAKQEKRRFNETNLPQLWILAATTTRPVLDNAGAAVWAGWPEGVYRLPVLFKTAIVAIDQLPETDETLWLRILGRGRTQERAIRELIAFPANYPRRRSILRLLSSWKVRIDLGEIQDPELRGTVMAFSQAFLEWEQTTREESIQQGLQQGLQQGEREILKRQLTRKLGALPDVVLEGIEVLGSEQLNVLALAVFDFSSLADLEAWLMETLRVFLLKQLGGRFGEVDDASKQALEDLSLVQWVAVTNCVVRSNENWQRLDSAGGLAEWLQDVED